MEVRNVEPEHVAQTTGVPLSIVQVVLTAVAAEPRATVRISARTVLVYFVYGDILQMEAHDGFVSIVCFGGMDQYFCVVVNDSITNQTAARAFMSKWSEVVVVDQSKLAEVLEVGLRPVFARISNMHRQQLRWGGRWRARWRRWFRLPA